MLLQTLGTGKPIGSQVVFVWTDVNDFIVLSIDLETAKRFADTAESVMCFGIHSDLILANLELVKEHCEYTGVNGQYALYRSILLLLKPSRIHHIGICRSGDMKLGFFWVNLL